MKLFRRYFTVYSFLWSRGRVFFALCEISARGALISRVSCMSDSELFIRFLAWHFKPRNFCLFSRWFFIEPRDDFFIESPDVPIEYL